MELDSLKAEIGSAEEAASTAEKHVSEVMNQESDLQMKVGEVKALYDDAKGELDEVEKRMEHCSADLSNLQTQRSDLVKAAEQATVEAKKLSVAITRMQKERAGAEKAVKSLLKKYPWIQSEKSAFGVAGGDYDFEATNPDEMSRQLDFLKNEQGSLVRTSKTNECIFASCEPNEVCSLLLGQEDQQEGHGNDRES